MKSIFIGVPQITIDGDRVPTTGPVKISAEFSKTSPIVHEILFTSFREYDYYTPRTVELLFPPGACKEYKSWKFPAVVAWHEHILPQVEDGPNVYKYKLNISDLVIDKLIEKF